MMDGWCLRRATALVFLVAFSIGIGSATARAQSSDDLAVMDGRVREFYQAGRYAEAYDLAQHALALAESRFGPNHPIVALWVNSIGILLVREGRYAQAEAFFKRKLEIREKTLGLDHPDIATALNNLAVLYDRRGRYLDADPLYERSLAIREKAFGSDHPDVAHALDALAELYFAQGDWGGATDFWQRSTDIIIRFTQRGIQVVGKDLSGKTKNEAQQLSWQFWGPIKATHRLAIQHPEAKFSPATFCQHAKLAA
jgi:tetratricopeptide (TPR) repeat protein